MFIYTVQPDDSLFSISQKFEIPVNMIRLVNGLDDTNIVPGQALLMNTNRYTVQPGDSFYTIAQMAYIPTEMLIEANPNIEPNLLQPGIRLTIPQPPDYVASTLSYFYVTGTPVDLAIINDFAPYTTYYSFFEFHIFSDGSLSSLDNREAIETVWLRNSAPLATITNLTEEGFSPELVNQTLNNPTSRQNLIDNIFNLVSTRGYAGVNIDFEGVLPEDRDVFSTFLTDIANRLHEAGLIITIAVPPKTSGDIPWYEGYDYGAIGSVVDFMFIMAYDWFHAESEPGPVAPIDEVRATIEYALETMDRSKIMLGVPLYGYDWNLPYNPNESATAVSNQDALTLAMRHGSTIQYSEEYKAPYFYYVDEQGQNHVIWFEDARSIAEKFQLVRDYRLLGTGAWQVGLGFQPGAWLLTRFFNIRRVT